MSATVEPTGAAPARGYRSGVPRRFLSPGWVVGHVIVLAAVLTCLRLGWWQWERSQLATGTGQNLGYSLLWPAFGAAFVYMWVRFLQLETIKDAEDAESDAADLEAAQLEDGEFALGGAQPTDEELAAFTGDGSDVAAQDERAGRRDRLQRPSEGVVIGVATVGADDDDDDPELTAYNRALAALAEEDRRRAR